MAFVRKELWLATNFAAKMIRENGYRNKAIKIASDYYDVSEKEISEQLAIRQSKGQKGKKRGKFKWYCVHGHMAGERTCAVDYYEKSFGEWKLVKALNQKNALNQLNKNNTYHEYGMWFVHGEIKEFNTEDDAKEFLRSER